MRKGHLSNSFCNCSTCSNVCKCSLSHIGHRPLHSPFPFSRSAPSPRRLYITLHSSITLVTNNQVPSSRIRQPILRKPRVGFRCLGWRLQWVSVRQILCNLESLVFTLLPRLLAAASCLRLVSFRPSIDQHGYLFLIPLPFDLLFVPRTSPQRLCRLELWIGGDGKTGAHVLMSPP